MNEPGKKPLNIGQNYEQQYGFHTPEKYAFKSKKGLSRKTVEEISGMKSEPDWMRQFRLRALEVFLKKPLPAWADLELLRRIDFENIYYYIKPTEKQAKTWEEVPGEIKETFEKLGIPEAERKFLAGVTAQMESEVVYHSIREDLEKQGVIFLGMDDGLRKHPEIVRKYFGTVIPLMDNKFASLNSAVWSGGSFIYVPKGVKVAIPLQAYFRINAENMGQFERTLIIADEGSSVHYVEGCTAPSYSSNSLHSAVVELVALPHAHIRYTTIQNWSKNVYNLVTKRAIAHENSIVEWLDGNLGCIRAGELVYAENGPKPIEKIEPGTRVWSFDEPKQQWVMRPVVAVKNSGLQKVYEAVFSNGRTLHLTENHPLLAVHHDASRPSKLGRYSLQWTPLQRLSAGDLVVFPTKLPTESSGHRFERPRLRDTFTGRNQYGARYEVASHARLRLNLPERANEETCWMLGLWIADGDYTIANGADGGPRYGRVGWSVPRKDRARKRLVRMLKQCSGNYRVEERRDGHYFRINSPELALWLQVNGLFNGTREKRVPHWVFALPTSMQRSFLAGYLDGDGCPKGPGLSARSANRSLLSDVQMLATSCGIHASAIYTDETTLDINGAGKAKTYIGHRLDLSRVRALRPYLSPGFRARMKTAKLDRNFQRPSGMRATRLLHEDVGVARITAIRPSGVAPTYDLEIDGTSSFVVNGILVHNSKLTMKYPAVHLVGPKARGEVVSVAFAGNGQHQDAGAKMIHSAPETSSTILSKSISKDGGRTSYRGLVKVYPQAENVRSSVRCDALLMDEQSRSDTYPTMEIDAKRVQIGHEATVSKVGEEQLFYLMSRGLKEQEATTMIVNGFFEAFTKELPLEYAVELNRLIQLEMEGSVG